MVYFYGHEELVQGFQVRKDMVYRYLEALSIQPPEYRAYDKGLRTSEGMVAYEKISFVRLKVLLSAYPVADSYIFQRFVKEAGPAIMLSMHYAVIDLVLMYASLQEVYCKTRQFLGQLRSKYLVYIKKIISSVL